MDKTLTATHEGKTYSRTTAHDYRFVVIRRLGDQEVVSWHHTRQAADRVPMPKAQKRNAKGEPVFRTRRGVLSPVMVDAGTKVVVVEVA